MSETPEKVLSKLDDLDLIYVFFSLPTCICLILLYEKPIRACLKLILNEKAPDPKRMAIAQRRLLNEPYFVVLLNAALWGLGSVFFGSSGHPVHPILLLPVVSDHFVIILG